MLVVQNCTFQDQNNLPSNQTAARLAMKGILRETMIISIKSREFGMNMLLEACTRIGCYCKELESRTELPG